MTFSAASCLSLSLARSWSRSLSFFRLRETTIMFAALLALVPNTVQAEETKQHLPAETYVGSISWAPGGKRLVVGYRKHVAAIMDAASGDVLMELDPRKESVVDRRFTIKADTNMLRDNWCPVSWSPDGKYVAVCHYLNVFIFDASTGKLLKMRSSERGKDFDPERRWNPILPRDAAGNTGSDSWREVLSYVTGLVWSKDSKKLAIADANGVHVVDIASGKELYTYEPMRHKTYSVSWSADGSKLAAISFNFSEKFKSLHIWNAETGKTIRELKGIKHAVWSPDSKYLAFDRHHGIEIYDPVSDKVRNEIATRDDFPLFYWSPDGKSLAVSDSEDIVVIVDAASGKKVTSYRSEKGKDFEDVFPAVFSWSPDGRSIALGLEDYTVGFWKPSVK